MAKQGNRMNDTVVTPTRFVATRRQLLAGGAAVAAVTLATARASSAQAAPAVAPGPTAPAPAIPVSFHSGGVDRATIDRWARDTWASTVAMVAPRTGLPADNISGSLASPTRSGYTS